MTDNLELRMYFLVNRSLSPMQKGIQAGHAVEQYVLKHGSRQEYKDYISWHKTWIVLDGGTSNTDSFGDMEDAQQMLEMFGIPHAVFHEPDLNGTLTAVCFLCDERVYDKEEYPDFEDWADIYMGLDTNLVNNKDITRLNNEWVSFLGGHQNLALRELLKDKRLAI